MSKIASTVEDDDSSQSRSSSKFNSFLALAPAQISYRLHPKRNPHSWFAFRLALGLFGAALVLLPLALPESWIASIFGLAFFLISILLPSALKSHSENEPSLEPHPKIVLYGADFCPGSAPSVRVQLYLSEVQILAMKLDLQPAAVIPVAQLSAVFLQRLESSWLLFLHWSGEETVFSFRGFSAGRNARKAESAIRRYVPLAPPEKPKARAARA